MAGPLASIPPDTRHERRSAAHTVGRPFVASAQWPAGTNDTAGVHAVPAGVYDGVSRGQPRRDAFVANVVLELFEGADDVNCRAVGLQPRIEEQLFL